MDEAAVKKLIDDAIAAVKAEFPSVDQVWDDVKAKAKGMFKTGLKGFGLVAALAVAIVAGHFL